MVNKIVKSFGFAINGLKITWKEELNFRIEVIIALLVMFFAYYFDFYLEEYIFCLLAITIVLSAEILNTAIEDFCNKVEPMTDPVIAKVKDTSSAFVLISGVGATITVVSVFVSHFV